MRVAIFLILSLAFSGCASRKPLYIPVGQLTDGSRVEWTNWDHSSWFETLDKDEGFVVLNPDDFADLLSSCKRSR